LLEGFPAFHFLAEPDQSLALCLFPPQFCHLIFRGGPVCGIEKARTDQEIVPCLGFAQEVCAQTGGIGIERYRMTIDQLQSARRFSGILFGLEAILGRQNHQNTERFPAQHQLGC
jgi:hypothetical protein